MALSYWSLSFVVYDDGGGKAPSFPQRE